MMRARHEEGMTLIEVVLGLLLFAMIITPLTLLTFNSLHDLFRARATSQRTDSYARSAYLLSGALANAQVPLREASDNQIEYRVHLDDGDRYVLLWRDCRTSSVQPGIYAAISSPRYNLVTNSSFEDASETAYAAQSGDVTRSAAYLRTGSNEGFPDDVNPVSAPPGTAREGTAAENTGTGRNPVSLGYGWPLGASSPAADGKPKYSSTNPDSNYNQDYTIGSPALWTRHYRGDENRGAAVAPTEWPQAERLTSAEAATALAAVGAPVAQQQIRAGTRALRLTTWSGLDPRRRAGNYNLPAQPLRTSSSYLQSQTFTASPGTRFLVGGYMADLTDGPNASGSTLAKRRPRIEWYWVTSKNGIEQVIPERSGAVTMPDTDDDTPDGGLNAPSNDFSTFRYKITRPAPEGTVGITLHLTAGQITGAPTASDQALFDGITLQPMSGPRIDTTRVNAYAARAASGAKTPHTYFDGSTLVTGSDTVAGIYAPTIAPPAGHTWTPYWLGTPFLSASGYGSTSFVQNTGETANTDDPRIQNRRQLLFAFDTTDADGNGISDDSGCGSTVKNGTSYTYTASNLLSYVAADGTVLTTASDRRTKTREVEVNLPVFKNAQTNDTLRFPIGSLLSSETPPATAPGLS
jgi:Tfp pilus assembly protein PilV